MDSNLNFLTLLSLQILSVNVCISNLLYENLCRVLMLLEVSACVGGDQIKHENKPAQITKMNETMSTIKIPVRLHSTVRP